MRQIVIVFSAILLFALSSHGSSKHFTNGPTFNLTYLFSSEIRVATKVDSQNVEGRIQGGPVSRWFLPSPGLRWDRHPREGFGFDAGARYEFERHFQTFGGEGHSFASPTSFSFLLFEANLSQAIDGGTWFLGLNFPAVVSQKGDRTLRGKDPGWQIGLNWETSSNRHFDLFVQEVLFKTQEFNGAGWARMIGLGLRWGFAF